MTILKKSPVFHSVISHLSGKKQIKKVFDDEEKYFLATFAKQKYSGKSDLQTDDTTFNTY